MLVNLLLTVQGGFLQVFINLNLRLHLRIINIVKHHPFRFLYLLIYSLLKFFKIRFRCVIDHFRSIGVTGLVFDEFLHIIDLLIKFDFLNFNKLFNGANLLVDILFLGLNINVYLLLKFSKLFRDVNFNSLLLLRHFSKSILKNSNRVSLHIFQKF